MTCILVVGPVSLICCSQFAPNKGSSIPQLGAGIESCMQPTIRARAGLVMVDHMAMHICGCPLPGQKKAATQDNNPKAADKHALKPGNKGCQHPCVTAVMPMKNYSSHKFAMTRHQGTATLYTATCFPHCPVMLCITCCQNACVTAGTTVKMFCI